MTPRIFILSFDKNGAIDHTVKKQLLDFIPNQVGSESAADVVCVPISYLSSYVFNTKLLEIKKKWIAIDFLEYGWSWSQESPNLLGHGNLAKCDFLNTPEYAKLDEFVKEHPPALTFKRELRQSDVTPKIVPADWLCYLPAKPLQSKEQFQERAFSTFFWWGSSHPSRPKLHGKIFIESTRCDYFLLDSWSMEQHIENRSNWVSIRVEHYQRKDIQEIMRWQRRAKISVNMPGCGVKNFRHSESPLYSVMAHVKNNLAFSYPWTEENSVVLREGFEFEDLLAATKSDGLYEKYLASQENITNYRSETWMRNFFMKHLEAVL